MSILISWFVLSVLFVGFQVIPTEYLYLGASMMLAAEYVEYSWKKGNE